MCCVSMGGFYGVVVLVCPAILCSMGNKNTEKVYEVSFHLVPVIDADKVPAVFDRLREVVAKEGEVLSEVSPVLCDLAYTVRHTVRQSDGSYNRYDKAYFGSVKFRALRDGVKRIEKVFKGDEEVLRFLLLETVADDTRIGTVLPCAEDGEAEVVEKSDGQDDGGGGGSGGIDEQGQGESGIAEHPEERGGEKTV